MDEKTRELFRQWGKQGSAKLKAKYGKDAHVLIGKKGAEASKKKAKKQ